VSIPGGLLPFARTQWFSNTGQPLAAGTLSFFQAGTTTPLAVYSDSALSVSLGTSVTLDANGRTPTNVYFLPQAYKIVLADSGANTIWMADNIEDVGSTVFGGLGTTLSSGARAVANNYTILGTDNFVTVSSTAVNPTVVNLPAATTRVAPSGLPLMIQNVGGNPVNVTPHGTDTINGANAVKSLPAVSGGNQPTYVFLCDGVSAWFIVASIATSVAPALAAWDSARAVQTIYQAATDGIAIGYIVTTSNATNAFLAAYTDSASTPVTVRQQSYVHRQDGTIQILGACVMTPVRKGDYWEIGQSIVAGTTAVTVFWIPTGN
jgi:hypothetical protein